MVFDLLHNVHSCVKCAHYLISTFSLISCDLISFSCMNSTTFISAYIPSSSQEHQDTCVESLSPEFHFSALHYRANPFYQQCSNLSKSAFEITVRSGKIEKASINTEFKETWQPTQEYSACLREIYNPTYSSTMQNIHFNIRPMTFNRLLMRENVPHNK